MSRQRAQYSYSSMFFPVCAALGEFIRLLLIHPVFMLASLFAGPALQRLVGIQALLLLLPLVNGGVQTLVPLQQLLAVLVDSHFQRGNKLLVVLPGIRGDPGSHGGIELLPVLVLIIE